MSEKLTMFVDESYRKDYVSVAVVVVQGEKNHSLILKVIKKLFLKPVFISTTKGKLHYSEESVGARQVIAGLIRELPVSAYIALTQLNVPTKKKERDELAYGTLLPKLLKAILDKYTKHQVDYSIEVIFENLSAHPNSDKVFFESKLKFLLGKYDFKVTVGTKETEKILYLPDYFLGFGGHLIFPPKDSTWPAQLFELVVDKIGVILNYGERIERYNRGEGVRKFLTSHRGK